MGKRWTWVAWSMLGVFVASLVLGLLLAVANGTFQPDAANQVALMLGFSAFMVVGALIVAHRPGNAVGWIFSAVGLLAFTGYLAVEYATYAYVTRPGSLPGAILAAWYGSWCWFPTIVLALVFTPLSFPTGQLLSPRWRPAAWLTGAATGALMMLGPSGPSWTWALTRWSPIRSGSPGWRTLRRARPVRPCSSCWLFRAWWRLGRWCCGFGAREARSASS